MYLSSLNAFLYKGGNVCLSPAQSLSLCVFCCASFSLLCQRSRVNHVSVGNRPPGASCTALTGSVQRITSWSTALSWESRRIKCIREIVTILLGTTNQQKGKLSKTRPNSATSQVFHFCNIQRFYISTRIHRP